MARGGPRSWNERQACMKVNKQMQNAIRFTPDQLWSHLWNPSHQNVSHGAECPDTHMKRWPCLPPKSETLRLARHSPETYNYKSDWKLKAGERQGPAEAQELYEQSSNELDQR
jgi:hypothetical protein